MRWAELLSLVDLRFRLLVRQKLGWISLAVGAGLVMLSSTVARVSFVKPEKIFWDFSLGASFVIQVALAIYLSTQLFQDEKNRRTLHLILSGGVSRLSWLVANGLGIWFLLTLMNLAWYGIISGVSAAFFVGANSWMAFQSVVLLSVEILVLVCLGLLLSLFLRPLLALVLSAVLTFFLHSLTSLQRVFTDPQVGHFVDDGGSAWVLWAARALPPLEWLDLKPFVGYQAQMDWSFVAQMSALGLMWSALIMAAAWLRFDRMDL